MFGGLLFAIGFSFIFSAWALARLIRDEMGGLFMGAAFTFIWMVAVVIIVERYRT